VVDAHKNFAYSTVATPPSPGVSGTSLVVAAGGGANFPTPPFNLTVWPIGVIPLPTNAEIARCTAISVDTLTLARAQEGSTARAIIAGDQVAASITAKTITDIETMLVYNGDYAAGNYVDGQIVVYNGIAYLCTSPTNTAPGGWPGGITPANPPLTTVYGTSLPASPYDGQEAILVDSVTNPTYQWRFRYNLGSTSAYKWEFIGGAPVVVSDATAQGVPNGSWGVWSAPIFAVPRPGEYNVTFAHQIYNSAGTVQIYYGVSISGAAPSTAVLGAVGFANIEAGWTIPDSPLTLSAGQDLRTGTYAVGATTVTARGRTLSVRPKRVS